MKFKLIFLLLFCAVQPTLAQSEVGIGIGLSAIQFRNEVISPLTHSGVALPIALSFQRDKQHYRLFSQLLYQHAGQLSSTFGNTTQEQQASFLIGYVRSIYSKANLHYYLGGMLQSQGAARNNAFGQNNADQALLNTLSVLALATYRVNLHQFEAQLSAGLLGINLRNGTNLSSQNSNNVQIESPPKYLTAALRLSYVPPLSYQHFKIRFDLNSSFYRFDQDQLLGQAQQQLLVNFCYKF